ncbi:MAG: hypothetical protein ACFCUI_05970 [Bernardetiaceae bacterium]
MNYLHLYRTYLIFGLFLLGACREDVPEIVDFSDDYAYAPLEQDLTRVYQVEETVYRLNAETTESRYQLRERIGRRLSAPDPAEERYELLRYRRADATQNWVLDSVWTIQKTADRLVRVENNVPFVRLRFPLREGRSWDGNSFNTRRRENYQITNFNAPKQISNFDFPETLTVIQRADSSLVNRDIRREVYARGVGLVERYEEEIFFCADPNTGCFGQGIIERGRIRSFILMATN